MTRAQLLAAGFSTGQIALRVRSGGLIPVHPGVYLVGHAALAPLARQCAAVLACRPRALLGDATAAAIHGLPVPRRPITVLVAGRHRRDLEGIRVRSITALAPGELRRYAGLPVASPALALLDLAGSFGKRVVRAALNEARVNSIVTDDELLMTIAAHRNRRGARALAALLDSERSDLTRSEAERRALDLMRSRGLEPEVNAVVGNFEVDFLFRAERLAVEVDGYRFHSTKGRFVADRQRAAALTARGLSIFPLSWVDLTTASTQALDRLEEALKARRAG